MFNDEFIRCDRSAYGWINNRIIRDKKTLRTIKRRNPDDLVFSSYKEATKFIHDNFLTRVNSRRDLERFFK